jgi:hypothetical protein
MRRYVEVDPKVRNVERAPGLGRESVVALMAPCRIGLGGVP